MATKRKQRIIQLTIAKRIHGLETIKFITDVSLDLFVTYVLYFHSNNQYSNLCTIDQLVTDAKLGQIMLGKQNSCWGNKICLVLYGLQCARFCKTLPVQRRKITLLFTGYFLFKTMKIACMGPIDPIAVKHLRVIEPNSKIVFSKDGQFDKGREKQTYYLRTSDIEHVPYLTFFSQLLPTTVIQLTEAKILPLRENKEQYH